MIAHMSRDAQLNKAKRKPPVDAHGLTSRDWMRRLNSQANRNRSIRAFVHAPAWYSREQEQLARRLFASWSKADADQPQAGAGQAGAPQPPTKAAPAGEG